MNLLCKKLKILMQAKLHLMITLSLCAPIFSVQAMIPVEQSKDLDKFGKKFNQYSPVRGMLVQNNNWLTNIYSHYGEIAEDHPSYQLIKQLFTEVPGEAGLKTTTRPSVPASLLSPKLVAQIFHNFEIEKLTNILGETNEVKVTRLSKKIADLFLQSEEYAAAVTKAKMAIAEAEATFKEREEADKLSKPFAAERDKLKKGPLSKWQTVFLNSSKDLEKLQAAEKKAQETQDKNVVVNAETETSDTAKKIHTLQQRIASASIELTKINDEIAELEKKIVTPAQMKKFREDLKYSKNFNAVGDEKYNLGLTKFAELIAQSFIAADFAKKPSEQSSPFFGENTTSDILLGGLWGKFNHKKELKDFFETAHQYGMLTKTLTAENYESAFDGQDYKKLEKLMIDTAIIGEPNYFKSYVNNQALSLAYTVLKPNGRPRPGIAAYKQNTYTTTGGYKYSNCTENALRNLFAFFLFNSETGKIDLKLLSELKDQGFKISPRLEGFFTRHPGFSEMDEMSYHVEWNDVVSELNEAPDHTGGVEYVHGHTPALKLGTCEIQPDQKNFMKVFANLTGKTPDEMFAAVNQLRGREIHHSERMGMSALGPVTQHVYEDKNEKFAVYVAYEIKHVTSGKEDKSECGTTNQVISNMCHHANKEFISSEETADIQTACALASTDFVKLATKATSLDFTPSRDAFFTHYTERFLRFVKGITESENYESRLPALLAYKSELNLVEDIKHLFETPVVPHSATVYKRNIAVMDKFKKDSPLFNKMVEIIKQKNLSQYTSYLDSRTSKDEKSAK